MRDLSELDGLLRVAVLSPSPQIATARLQTGLAVMETGPGFWTGRFETKPLVPSERRKVEAFLAALSGAVAFRAYDLLNCWPAAHPGGAITGSWADTLSVTAVSALSISATAPNAALTLRAGDRVSIETATVDSLHVLTADATRAAGVLTMQVRPAVPAGLFGAGSTLRLRRPRCQMMIDWSADQGLPGERLASVAFTAIQKPR